MSKKRKNSFRNLFLSIILLMTLFPTGPTLAKVSKKAKTEVELRGGHLKYLFEKDQKYDFGEVDLGSSKDTKRTRSEKIKDQTISDMRGTGEGYNLSVSATRFSNINNRSVELDAGSLSIKAPTSKSFTKKTSDSTGNGTIKYGTNKIDGASATLLYAKRNSGMGEHKLTYAKDSLRFQIVQNDARRGIYESTITFTLSSGPN